MLPAPCFTDCSMFSERWTICAKGKRFGLFHLIRGNAGGTTGLGCGQEKKSPIFGKKLRLKFRVCYHGHVRVVEKKNQLPAQFSVCLISRRPFPSSLEHKGVSFTKPCHRGWKTARRMSVPPSSRPASCLCLPARAFRGRSGRAGALSGASVRKNTSSFSLLALSHIWLSPSPTVQEERRTSCQFSRVDCCVSSKEKAAACQMLFPVFETCVWSQWGRVVLAFGDLYLACKCGLLSQKTSSCGEKESAPEP